jgi:ribonuclease R
MPRSDRKNRAAARQPQVIEVLDFFQFYGRKAFRLKQISKELGMNTPAERQWLLETLEGLVAAGKIAFKFPDQFSGLSKESKASEQGQKRNVLTGKVDFVNPKYAFVVVEAGKVEVKVSESQLNGALHDDTVEVEVGKQNRGGRHPEGRVTAVLQRSRDTFVGRVEISARYAFVVPDFRKMFYDIFVPPHELNGAKHGEKVVVRLTSFPERNKKPEGKIERVLGMSGEHQTEMHSIMAEFGLPFEFPKDVENEAERIPDQIAEKELASRRDFRKIATFTIDPDNAKDFDDALSIRMLDNGMTEVGVHIADVTHYVREGTLLEREAQNRATSVYLVDRTIPMLPEKLSNNLCSLVPHQDRLTMSAVFVLNQEGEILEEWFGKTVIHSAHRFTYEEAQEVIEGKSELYKKEIHLLNHLALKLRQRRFAEGAITFETIELKFKLAEDGTPLGMFPKERKDAHKLIEDFMLLANKRVAEYVHNTSKGKQEPAMVYRVHESPDPEKVRNFAGIAARFGYPMKLDAGKLALAFNKLVDSLEGKEEQNVLQSMAIRTMAKARYGTEPLGHFGLAFPFYTHFTSPIRRYPDMMAHRLLMHYLKGGSSTDKEELDQQCKHSSEREKRASDAERASIKYKQVEYIRNYGKKVFEGIVSGMTDYGIFVEMTETRCEGMVRVSDLMDDYYEFDEKNFRMVGKRNKKHINLGQKVMVKVKGTDLDRRTIDLTLLNPREADDF